jgi:predicted DsbA family dithiol-disulfide isomerase
LNLPLCFYSIGVLPPAYPISVDRHEQEEHCTNKFGPERFAKVLSILDARGERFGIKFNFDGPIRQSGPCHRLIRYAYEKQRELQIGSCVPTTPCIKNDMQGKLLNLLFKATFQDREDIRDEYVLARCAEEVGLMSQEEVCCFL